MTDSQIERLAATLWQAETERRVCEPLTEALPTLGVEDAYSIASHNIQRKVHDHGRHIVGRKIGLTSQAVQQWLGVTEPDFGCLMDDMWVGDGAVADTGRLLQPRVEGEIAFVLGEDLRGPGVTAAAVLAATRFVLPAIEIIDSRIRDWKIQLADTVADNASSGLFVLGTRARGPLHIDFRLAGMALRKNGETASVGAGAACLDNPLNAVAWLANKLGALGTTLRRGDVVLSGALGPVVPIAAGDHVEVEIGPLGTVGVRFG